MSQPSFVIEQSELFSIGAVVEQLRPEYPADGEITISKIRFLESEGIVNPLRTPSGYRKFSPADVQRIRYTLKMQRDHFLPLRVIREHLEKLDQGFEPASTDSRPRVPASQGEGTTIDLTDHLVNRQVDVEGLELTIGDIADDTGLKIKDILDIAGSGLIARRRGSENFGHDALQICKLIGKLGEMGLEWKSLRPIKNAAEKQADLIELVMSPYAKGRGGSEREEFVGQTQQLLNTAMQLEAMLIRRRLKDSLGI